MANQSSFGIMVDTVLNTKKAFRKNFPKKIKKTVDKPLKICYNNYTR